MRGPLAAKARVEIVDWLWSSALAPAFLMRFLWPWFIGVIAFGAGMGLLMRSIALARTPVEKLHPIMHSPARWAVVMAAVMFTVFWVVLAAAVATLAWAVHYRPGT